MTTAIRDSYAALDSALIGRSGQGVYVGIDKTSLPHRADVIIPRDEFLAAVATELGVIVIDRTDLPEVTKTDAHDQPDRDHYVRHRDTGQVKIMRGKSAEKHRRWATEHLALAEHLDANPPVDEAQVNAVAAILSNEGDGGIWEHFSNAASREVARHLVKAGVRAPQAGDDQ